MGFELGLLTYNTAVLCAILPMCDISTYLFSIQMDEWHINANSKFVFVSPKEIGFNPPPYLRL